MKNEINNNQQQKHQSLYDVLGGEKLTPGGFIKTFKDIFYFIKKCDVVDLSQLAWRIFLVVVLILFLALPFQLCRDLGANLVVTIIGEFSDKTLAIWNGFWNISYSIVGLLLFYFLIKGRFYKLANHEVVNKTLTKENVINGVNQAYNNTVNTVQNIKDTINNTEALNKELEENKPDYSNPNFNQESAIINNQNMQMPNLVQNSNSVNNSQTNNLGN